MCPPPRQSRIDTPAKCKRILDDAGLGDSYDDNTPAMKLRVLAAGALAAEAGVVAATPAIVPDIEVHALFSNRVRALPRLRRFLPH